MKKTLQPLIFTVAVISILTTLTPPARAAIVTSGYVEPGVDNWQANATGVIVGRDSYGSLEVTDGSQVNCGNAQIGYNSGSTGQTLVDGIGSKWTNSFFTVGVYGNGTMNIANGGLVTGIGPASGSGGYGIIARYAGSTGQVTVDGAGSRWTWIKPTSVYVGLGGSGTLDITNGGEVVCTNTGYIGNSPGSTGWATVDGTDSKWSNRASLVVGYRGAGTLNITDGGQVISNGGRIAQESGTMGQVTVNGAGSKWTNSESLYFGRYGSGTLDIINGGLISVAETLTFDIDDSGDDFINMSTGGMLALFGEADGSIDDFLALINGTGPIRYWNSSISDWANITGAIYGTDYTLSYETQGDLEGYTVLTVPEPCTLILLGLGGLLIKKRSY